MAQKRMITLDPIELLPNTQMYVCALQNQIHASDTNVNMDAELRDITISFDGNMPTDRPVEITLEEPDTDGTWSGTWYPGGVNGPPGINSVRALTGNTVAPASDGAVFRWYVTPTGGLITLPFYGSDALLLEPITAPGINYFLTARAPAGRVYMSVMLGVWQ